MRLLEGTFLLYILKNFITTLYFQKPEFVLFLAVVLDNAKAHITSVQPSWLVNFLKVILSNLLLFTASTRINERYVRKI